MIDLLNNYIEFLGLFIIVCILIVLVAIIIYTTITILSSFFKKMGS